MKMTKKQWQEADIKLLKSLLKQVRAGKIRIAKIKIEEYL